MQLTLTRVVVREALHGVHLVKRNRNVTLAACNLYNNRGIGLFLDGVNLHQINVANCHISYNHGGGVVVRGSELRNLQIGSSDIVERRVREPASTGIAQPLPSVRGEARDVIACRADAEGERLPPLVEAREPHRRGECRLLHRGQTGGGKQLGEVALRVLRASCDSSITSGSSSRAACQNVRDRRALRVIPYAGGDGATRDGHALHLRQPGDRVGHEVHDELRERRAEDRVVEGEPLGGRAPTSTPGKRSRAAATNASDGSTAATSCVPSRRMSSAVSAPGPQPTSSTRRPARTPAGPARNSTDERRRVPAHVPVVRPRRDLERHAARLGAPVAAPVSPRRPRRRARRR